MRSTDHLDHDHHAYFSWVFRCDVAVAHRQDGGRAEVEGVEVERELV